MVDKFNFVGAKLMMSVAVMFTLVFAPSVVFAAKKVAHEVRVEVRIKDMHDKLKITTMQEQQWSKVEQAMREDAKNLDALTQARSDNANKFSAVDDLKSYGEIAEAHATGIKNLTPLFAALYDGMSDVQKKEADALFRHGDHKHGHKYHDDK